MDRLIARARTEAGPALRHALYRELEDMLAGDAIILPMFHEQSACRYTNAPISEPGREIPFAPARSAAVVSNARYDASSSTGLMDRLREWRRDIATLHQWARCLHDG